MAEKKGDAAFRLESNKGRIYETNYGGALSFLRRRYTRDLTDVDVVVSGIPFDNAVTGRPGTRYGPRAIREASTGVYELDAFPWGFDIFEHLSIIDYGDCQVDPHHPETIVDTIADHARTILKSDAKMLTLGGDHFTTYPLLKAHAEKYGPIALIQFDAHGDLWEDDSTRIDHGTMFARGVNEGIIDPSKSSQVGIRTWVDSDMGLQVLTAPWVHENGIPETLKRVVDRAGDAPVYITWDIDGFDPAYAPGTGTPVVGGLASWQGLQFLRGLGGLNLIGMDVVEVSPPYDHAEITALLAATVAHDFLALLVEQKLANV
ncbi:MAG: agmatinase [Pseudomonadota bacterium]